MNKSLFRKEAVDHKTNGFTFITKVVSPLSFEVLSVFVLLVAAAVIAFVVLGRYSPKDTVHGYVTTTMGNVEIYAPSDGTILVLGVAEGDTVAENEELLTLATSRAAGHSAETNKDILRALRAEQRDLQLQADLERKAFAVQEQGISDEILSLRGRLSLLREQREDMVQVLQLSERALARLTSFEASEFVSSAHKDEARTTIVEHNFRLKDLDLEADSVRSDMRRMELRLAEAPVVWQAREAELRVKLHELSVKIIEKMGRSTQRVRAPMDGVVSGLLVREGQTVSSSSPLLNIIPEDGDYCVELLVPTRTIAFVRPGAPVKIRYDAYPYQKFGTHDGVVDSVSRTTVLPTDKRFRIKTTEPVYVARVKISQHGVAAYGKTQPLQAGMTLSADVLREQRGLIEWVFDPLISAARKL
jgi:membrane fusion protein